MLLIMIVLYVFSLRYFYLLLFVEQLLISFGDFASPSAWILQ